MSTLSTTSIGITDRLSDATGRLGHGKATGTGREDSILA